MNQQEEGRALRVGFIDFQLENYHANIFLKAIRHDLTGCGAKVTGCYALDAPAGRVWAQKNQVPWYDSPLAMKDDVDALMILAPSNPELHLKLVQKSVPLGKPIYLDKPAAQNARTLERIFELVDEHGVALQTSSALRYTAVQQELSRYGREVLEHIISWAPGRSFEEYGIHPVEMAVSCLGSEAESLLCRQSGNFWQLLVNFSRGRTATIHLALSTAMPYAGMLLVQGQSMYITPDTSRIFVEATSAILQFLKSGQPNIPREESLAVMRILDAAAKPAARKRFIRLE